MPRPHPNTISLSETQRLKHWWIWLIFALTEALILYIFIRQIIFEQPVGNNPASDAQVWIISILAGIELPLLVYSVRLVTDVHQDRVVVRFSPIWRRTVYLRELVKATPCTYRPIVQYGGWGIRYGINNGWCYTMYGNRGVNIEFADGRKVLIGSQKPEELAAAISCRLSGH